MFSYKRNKMNKRELEAVLKDLRKLQNNLLLANKTKDRRCRDKRIREAKLAISDYAHYLPEEVACILWNKVDVNPMSYQYAENDIKRSITVIEEWIKTLPESSQE